jgi:hypothetical protein
LHIRNWKKTQLNKIEQGVLPHYSSIFHSALLANVSGIEDEPFCSQDSQIERTATYLSGL